MEYRRFLNNNDYKAIITDNHLNQLLRDVPGRIVQSEQCAEMDVREYLDQFYEVERELEKGKSIMEYNHFVSYPPGVFFFVDGKIFRTLCHVNGCKKPHSIEYWRLVNDFDGIDLETVNNKFMQTHTYYPGDVVEYMGEYYHCVNPCGWDFNNIVIPDSDAWERVEFSEWEIMVEYEMWDVVRYNDAFYILSSVEAYDPNISPDVSDNWGLLGNYDEESVEEYKFEWGEDSHDYVVLDGEVWRPVLNPNCDNIEVGKNIVPGDPRNLNLIKHMTRISLYYLHQTISPTNVSETRRMMYEDSMNWLVSASKLRLNPQIPRKKNKETGQPKDDWAMATFQRDFDPNENMWLI